MITDPKILLVAGARPNFMKIAPLVRELSKRNGLFDYRIIHTGQHYDRDMSDVFFEELEIPPPHRHLDVGSGSHAEQTARIMVRFEEACLAEKPKLVIVVGDVNSTLACAIVAKKLQVEVAHIEAGLRSRDRTMPEEINRIVTDSVSDYFFVTERSGVDNLLSEGKDHGTVYFVGHVMIDNLLYQVKKLRENPNVAPFTARLKLGHPRYGVVTIHRPSNVDNPEILGQLVATLAEIGRELPLIFPMHPRTQSSIEKYRIDMPKTLIYTRPLPYMEFLNLFMDATLVLTDSGGIQEETTALGIPCLTLRENTERPITVSEGTNSLVGTDPSRIQSETRKILSGHSKTGSRPELWDGKAAQRIIDILATGLAR